MQAAICMVLTSGVILQSAGWAQSGSVASGLYPPSVAPPPSVLSPRAAADQAPGLTDEMRGDIMMARKMYRDAIDFYKPHADKVAVLANKTGIAYHQINDLDNAKKYYERAIKLDKKYSEAVNNLGAIYYAKKNYSNAIKQYQKALAISPNTGSMWTNLGTAYFSHKDYAKALAAYQTALKLDPEVFEHRGTGGVLLQERSVEEKALFYYTLAKSYAQAGAVEYTIRYARFALENGFKEKNKFAEEPEFVFLRDNMEFQDLLATPPHAL